MVHCITFPTAEICTRYQNGNAIPYNGPVNTFGDPVGFPCMFNGFPGSYDAYSAFFWRLWGLHENFRHMQDLMEQKFKSLGLENGDFNQQATTVRAIGHIPGLGMPIYKGLKHMSRKHEGFLDSPSLEQREVIKERLEYFILGISEIVDIDAFSDLKMEESSSEAAFDIFPDSTKVIAEGRNISNFFLVKRKLFNRFPYPNKESGLCTCGTSDLDAQSREWEIVVDCIGDLTKMVENIKEKVLLAIQYLAPLLRD